MKLPGLRKRTDCDDCPAHCCKYVIVETDEPESWYDFQNYRWIVAHKDVTVLKNKHEWYVKYSTECEHLDKHNKCSIYNKRPVMCRRHKIETCEISGYEDEHDIEFRGIVDFDAWLKEEKKKRLKRKKVKKKKKKKKQKKKQGR